jgi:hypothetical protein
MPISPQELQKKKQQLGHGSRSAAATALRGAADGRAIPDSYYDHSNYKPLLEP